MTETETVPLSRAAHRLRLSWHAAWRLVLTGAIEGEQDDRGRWRVRADDVERLLRQRRAVREELDAVPAA